MRGDDAALAVAERARTVLAAEVSQSWRAAVDRHHKANPFTPEEWASVAALEGWKGQQVLKRHPELAYGSTILAVLATETHVLCLQLGDGDILFVDSQGHTRRAVPRDDQVATKQTSSLWRRNAAAEVRIHVYDGLEDLPALVLAATDGYAESYKSDKDFLEIGTDYLGMVRNEGFDSLEHRLKDHLDETSWGGSGDDITVGLISRLVREQVPDVDAIKERTHA